MFEEMIDAIQEETVRRLYSVRLRKNEEVKRERVAKATARTWAAATAPRPEAAGPRCGKVPPNDPAPAAAA